MTDDTKPSDRAASGDADFQFPSLHGEAPADAAAHPATPSEPTAVSATPPPPRGPRNAIVAWALQHKSTAMFIAFIVLAVGMWGIAYMRNHKKAEPQEQEQQTQGGSAIDVPVNAAEARLGRFQDAINSVGTLKGEAEIELRFEVDGKIEEFGVSEGAKVRKGQLIARLNDRDARLKVQRAKIELEQNEKLFTIGGVSKTKLDEARLNLEVAQTELDKTHLIAARDGILGDKSADVGEFVTPQRKIAKLVAIKNVVVEAGIIEKMVDKVFPGQKVLVTVDAYPGNVFEGKIETISPIVSEDGSKTFSIRSKIPNPDSLLLPGMFARTKIITFEADDTIAVPNDAVVKTQGGFQVFVVNKDNIAEARDVQVGYISNEQTQIQGGITPGETIVVQRPPELKAGAKVKIIEVQK